MRKTLMLASAAMLAFAPAVAHAAGAVTTGAAGGAVTGAIVGGPVGAAVGGVIGAIIGLTIEPPPPEVVSYVALQEPPPVILQGNLAIGATLPETVVLYPVPADVYVTGDAGMYTYAIVNGQRVIVDPRTRAVVAFVG